MGFDCYIYDEIKSIISVVCMETKESVIKHSYGTNGNVD